MLLEQINGELARLAEELGLSFQPEPRRIKPIQRAFYDYPKLILPALNGQLDGISFSLKVTKSYEKNLQGQVGVHYLDMKLEMECRNPRNYTLEIYREGIISQMGKWFGMQDIILGNKSFDEYFIVKSNNEQFVRAVLDEKILKSFSNRRRYFSGTISFGDFRSKTGSKTNLKRKSKGAESILDSEYAYEKSEKQLEKDNKSHSSDQHIFRYGDFGFIPDKKDKTAKLKSMLLLLADMAKNIKIYCSED